MRTIRAAYRADFCVLLFSGYLPACIAILPSSAKRGFSCYSLVNVQPAFVAVSLFALWPHYTPTAANVNSSIAQKSAADFMQIDETDILIYIV